MIYIGDKTKCCGCTACASICPKKCIKMVADAEGFLYPQANVEMCINCGLCERICPVITPEVISNQNPVAKIVRNVDADIVKDSTSGGAFSGLAMALIRNKNALVYGAAYNKDMDVYHCAITEENELKKIRGSKFVQSNVCTLYEEIEKQLIEGKTVLFSGTPCQVAGLKKFIGNRNADSLYCIDIVCRGVPSPRLWKIYVAYMETRFHSRIVDVKFRNKTYGYKSSTMFVQFENGRVYKKSGRIDPMMKLFTREICSRPSCSECVFKGRNRVSDLTLFDCKKYTIVTNKKDDDKGYTAVLIQSEKGREMLNLADDFIDIQNADIDKLIKYCGVMVEGRAQPNKKRDMFFADLGKVPLNKLVQRVSPISLKDRFIEATKGILYQTGLINVARKFKKHEEISIKQ